MLQHYISINKLLIDIKEYKTEYYLELKNKIEKESDSLFTKYNNLDKLKEADTITNSTYKNNFNLDLKNITISVNIKQSNNPINYKESDNYYKPKLKPKELKLLTKYPEISQNELKSLCSYFSIKTKNDKFMNYNISLIKDYYNDKELDIDFNNELNHLDKEKIIKKFKFNY